MKINHPVTQHEVGFSAEANILSTTNLKGAITYVNDDFVEVSGFDREELIGKNHNIVRHPDMPPAAFGDLWAHIEWEIMDGGG
jgi:aerotaxis receptor